MEITEKIYIAGQIVTVVKAMNEAGMLDFSNCLHRDLMQLLDAFERAK